MPRTPRSGHHARGRHRQGLAAAALLLAIAAPLAAQSLPHWRPINPLVASRTALGFVPLAPAAIGWRVEVLADYGSLVESSSRPTASVLVDAEVFRLTTVVTRRLGSRTFLQLTGSLHSAQAGFLDGPINWYHDLVGFNEATRRERPRNTFDYRLTLPGGTSVEREEAGFGPGEFSAGLGVRHTAGWQTVVRVFVPTASHTEYRHTAVATGVMTTLRSDTLGGRLVLEGSAGVGLTPRDGDLAPVQRTGFASASAGGRVRFLGRQWAYANLFVHSPLYRNTTVPALDRADVSLDVGFLLQPGNGPEIVAGLVEDLYAFGPAVDLTLRVGLRW